jgi:Fe2+ or Zn2+ uptake regulation protein
VESVERNIGQQFNFAATSHSFQIYGICQSCQIKQQEKLSER